MRKHAVKKKIPKTIPMLHSSQTKVIKRQSKQAMQIAEKVIQEIKEEEERQNNLRLAREFEYADLTKQSIEMQNKAFKKMGYNIEEINKLREKIIEEDMPTEKVAEELKQLKEERILKNLITNKGRFKRKTNT